MTSLRLIDRDFKNLLIKNRILILGIISIFWAAVWINADTHIFSASVTGCCKTAFEGCLRFDPGSGMQFTIPITWFLLMYLICYSSAAYNAQELTGARVQVVLHSSSRKCWWFSKCAALIIWTLLCHLIGMLSLSVGLLMKYKTLPVFSSGETIYQIIQAFLLPYMSSAFLVILQFCITVLFSFTASQITLITLLTLASFFDWPVLGITYSMAIRYMPGPYKALNPVHGIIYQFSLIVLMIIGGYFIFKKSDIYPKK